MAVDAARRHDALALGKVSAAREREIGGHNALSDNLLLAIDVGQVRVQRPHALREAFLQAIPHGSLDNARHGVERKQALAELPLLIQAELHAITCELRVYG